MKPQNPQNALFSNVKKVPPEGGTSEDPLQFLSDCVDDLADRISRIDI